MTTHVFYHGHCPDGFCAAWAAWLRLGASATYHPAFHDAPASDILAAAAPGSKAFLLDFSLGADELTELCRRCDHVEVIDHHEKAVKALAGLAVDNLSLTLDVAKSGGRLAWERFHGDRPAPWLVDYTEDRDLWRWALPASRELSAAVASHPHDFELWSSWCKGVPGRTPQEPPVSLVMDGQAILRYQQGLIDRLVKNAAMVSLGGVTVPAVNTPVLQSEVAGAMAEGHPFAACFHEAVVAGRRVRQWSLRSTGLGMNVNEVAMRYGGGGHPRSAGFSEAV